MDQKKVNGLNLPIKIKRETELIKKQDPFIWCLCEPDFKRKDKHSRKVKY